MENQKKSIPEKVTKIDCSLVMIALVIISIRKLTH